MTRILVFAGSTRQGSYNKQLARLAARDVAAAGAEATFLDLRDFPMPLYDGDLEAGDGPPEHAFRLQEIVAQHHGLIVASPEYNNSISAVLKNTLDWVSRTPRLRGANPFAGKPAALISASPGGLGGLRGLDAVRNVLNTVGMLVLPGMVAVGHADQAFDADGGLKDIDLAERLRNLTAETVRTARALSA